MTQRLRTVLVLACLACLVTVSVARNTNKKRDGNTDDKPATEEAEKTTQVETVTETDSDIDRNDETAAENDIQIDANFTRAVGELLNNVLSGGEQKIVTVGQPGGLGVFVVQLFTMTVLSWAAIYLVYAVALPYVEHRSLSLGLWETMASFGSGFLDEDSNLLGRVINSIEEVDFSLDKVDKAACGKFAVCELQRRLPLLASVFHYIRPSILEQEEYREAEMAGADLEDCTLLYSQCPNSLAEAMWGAY